MAVTVTSVGFGLLVGHAPAAGTVESRGGLRDVLRVPGIRPALTVAFVYILGLTAVLTYYIPAVRSAGFTRTQAAVGFTLVNVVAGISRPLWGRLRRQRRRHPADAHAARDGHGRRRRRR